jgi:DNA mismatch repair ATPase MutS
MKNLHASQLEEITRDRERYASEVSKKNLNSAKLDWKKEQEKLLNNAFEKGLMQASSKDTSQIIEKIRSFYLDMVQQITEDIMSHAKQTQVNAAKKISDSTAKER